MTYKLPNFLTLYIVGNHLDGKEGLVTLNGFLLGTRLPHAVAASLTCKEIEQI
jgi:hypothetical protein